MWIYYIAFETTKVLVLWLTIYFSGNLVYKFNIKVNYTRKITHFGFFFIPILLAALFPKNMPTYMWSITPFVTLFSYSIFAEPIRKRFPLIKRMFLAIDRPEDRPHTLSWILSQLAVGSVVAFVVGLILGRHGYGNLFYMILLIVIIGDGLAEVVGVRFGKHKYKVSALFSNKKYQRSIEGSATVFISALVFTFLHMNAFTEREFVAALLIIPISMTLTEALSPHTWDSPFLLAVGGSAIFFIKDFI